MIRAQRENEMVGNYKEDDSLKTANYAVTYQQLHSRLRFSIDDAGYPQHPQLEGVRSDAFLFGEYWVLRSLSRLFVMRLLRMERRPWRRLLAASIFLEVSCWGVGSGRP